MSIFLWTLQVLLALHTIMGALWKFSNSEQAVPSLSSIPHEAWIAIAVIELFLALFLILPAMKKSFAALAPVAAIGIAAIMFAYTGLHLASGNQEQGQVTYWLVVAAVCLFIAYGRLVLRPLGRNREAGEKAATPKQ